MFYFSLLSQDVSPSGIGTTMAWNGPWERFCMTVSGTSLLVLVSDDLRVHWSSDPHEKVMWSDLSHQTATCRAEGC